MTYPKMPDFNTLSNHMMRYAQLKHEYGSKGIEPLVKKAERASRQAISKLKSLPISKKLAAKEPNKLSEIKKLRPAGPRKMRNKINSKIFQDRLEGALLGRCAGCTLGAVVEFEPIEKMERLAKVNAENFPPTDYWSNVDDPLALRYGMSERKCFTRKHMNAVPVDDDIAYTLIGLLIAEEYGHNFTVENVGQAWLKYLPHACTAEKVALENLKKQVPAKKAGEKDNPYCEWIGAFIRSDPWGYLAPGWPEKAAQMAHTDAYISHRRQGIYGEMYFAAAISAAFAVDDPVEALKIGLTEIPKECTFAKEARWALSVASKIKTFRQARDAMEKRYRGMHRTHTINNAALTIWGITIGKRDLTRTIGETVAMGMDNDCTAATAGSVVGATIGKRNIPRHWYARFNNIVKSYLIGHPKFRIDNLLKRFIKQAENVFSH